MFPRLTNDISTLAWKSMALCRACSSISVSNLTRLLDHRLLLGRVAGTQSNKPRGMVLFDDARDLIASATAGCPFCELIVHAVLEHSWAADTPTNGTHSSNEPGKRDIREFTAVGGLTSDPILLQTNYDPVKSSFPEDGRSGSWHIRGLKVHMPVDHEVGMLTGRIRLYASRGE